MLIIKICSIVLLVISLLKAMLLGPKASNYFFFSSSNDQDLVLGTSLNESSKQLFSLAISVIFCGLYIITCARKGIGSCEQPFSRDLIKVMRERPSPEIELEGGSGLHLHILASTLCIQCSSHCLML